MNTKFLKLMRSKYAYHFDTGSKYHSLVTINFKTKEIQYWKNIGSFLHDFFSSTTWGYGKWKKRRNKRILSKDFKFEMQKVKKRGATV